MNKIISLIIFLVSVNLYSQKDVKLAENIKLSENFISSTYETPKSILFYYGGHSEFSTYYESLSHKVKRRLKKVKLDYKQVIDLSTDANFCINSFDEIDIKFDNEEYDAVCVFFHGELLPPKMYKSNNVVEREVNYYLYMMLIESRSNQVLLKKKLKVASKHNMITENQTLAKVIVNELKLFKR
jgi:hypothetical protein